MRELSARSLTFAYLTALGIVAMMSLASHLTLRRVLSEHQSAAAVVNESGRQRMWSQRIASLAAQSALGDATARDELGRVINLFADAHRDLIDGNPAKRLPPLTTPEIQHLYYGGAVPLDRQVAEYIARARAVQLLPAGDPRLPEMLKPLSAMARKPLLDGLDAVVSAHQRTSEAQLEFLQWLQNLLIVAVFVTLFAEAVAIFRPMVRRIVHYTRALLQLATIDPLTGALNRRSFTERAMAELNRANRTGHPLCFLAIDADRFKLVNDTYGHAAGDAVLKALTGHLKRALRPSDICGRMGGEEFAVLLPETDLHAAQIAADRIRKGLETLTVPFGDTQIRFTISIGVAAAERGAVTLDSTMQQADEALYRAKNSGRNRVVLAGAAIAPAPRSAAGGRVEKPNAGLAGSTLVSLRKA